MCNIYKVFCVQFINTYVQYLTFTCAIFFNDYFIDLYIGPTIFG